MSNQRDADMKTLESAFAEFTRTTAVMGEWYRALQTRIEQLDKALEEKNRELAVANDYLNYILESMSDGVIAVDTDDRITRFNRAACEALGYAAEDVVGRRFQDVFRREFAAPPGGRHPMELRARDGRTFPVSERDAPISDRNNKRIGTVKVFEDLTEVEALRQRVRQKDRLAALGEMAATVAHEIRNPLGGLKGYAALLARDVDAEDSRARLVSKVLEGANQLELVVSDLLEYTRPVQLQLEPVNCAETVEAVVRYLGDVPKGVRLRQSVGEGHYVLADRLKLRQVLLNILQNAVQSIDGEGEVSVSCSVQGGCAVLTISDTGRGIAPELIEKVFSPFYTTREKGTGLGLAVAAKIVEAHGGKLWADSVEGEGSRFHVRLTSVGKP
ncbi:MAG TPA: ATP-binding protein [Candidatus Hydrogenedentes bacterium]|nr:ATP-binding protein [Candidatus Hydrogenedentota bacterium]